MARWVLIQCNNCLLTPPPVKVHSLSVLGVESSHELLLLVRWNQLPVGLQIKVSVARGLTAAGSAALASKFCLMCLIY